MRPEKARTACPNFPDSRIGASLKLERLVDATRLLYNFPDSRIGASLKRVIERAPGLGPHHFPDSRIGASLKPVQARGESRAGDTSPIRESGPH